MNSKEYKLSQGVKLWNMAFTVFFLMVNYYFICLLTQYYDLDFVLFNLETLDYVLIAFSVFRIIRLFVYDNLTLSIREAFMDLIQEDGKYYFVESKNAFKLTVSKLLNCPWCFGVWAAAILTYLYLMFPELKVLFVILSVSAIASMLQITTNMIGWIAEKNKKEVNR